MADEAIEPNIAEAARFAWTTCERGIPDPLATHCGRRVPCDDEIDDRVTWDTATEKLLPLKEAVESLPREIEAGNSMIVGRVVACYEPSAGDRSP